MNSRYNDSVVLVESNTRQTVAWAACPNTDRNFGWVSNVSIAEANDNASRGGTSTKWFFGQFSFGLGFGALGPKKP
jgi:hypothetical protein